MDKKIISLCIVAIVTLAMVFPGCKKDSSDTTTTTPFKADTAFTVINASGFPNYVSWSSIAIDPIGNKIFYYYPNTAEGFKIDMLDLASGSSTTIYKHFTQSGLSTRYEVHFHEIGTDKDHTVLHSSKQLALF